MHQRRYFGTDGIRDLANRGHLTPDMVLKIGHAIGRVAHESMDGSHKKAGVVIIRDTRVSGDMIGAILSGAIMAHGVDVYDAGVLPTPAAPLLIKHLGLQLGIVVSASHNPMPDNGIKIFGPDARKLSDDTELEIEKFIDLAGSRDVDFTAEAIGRHRDFAEGRQIYLDAIVKDFFKDLDLSGMKIVIDCSNGSGHDVSPEALRSLGAEVIAIHNEPDGFNINRDSGVFAVKKLGPIVLEHGAHLGMALDGDGDRVILVDELGEVQDGDKILAVLSESLKDESDERRQVVATVMSNMGLKALAKARGFTLHQTAVGDRYVAEKMAESGAHIGGEQSGHIIFHNEHGWFGDGLYTALRVIEIMHASNEKLSRLASAMERFPQILQNVLVSEKPPISEIFELQEAIRHHQIALGEDGRILVRYSGTEMLARVMVEGRDLATIEAIAAELTALLKKEIG